MKNGEASDLLKNMSPSVRARNKHIFTKDKPIASGVLAEDGSLKAEGASSETFGDYLERLKKLPPDEADRLKVDLARGMSDDEEMGQSLANLQESINKKDREAKERNSLKAEGWQGVYKGQPLEPSEGVPVYESIEDAKRGKVKEYRNTPLERDFQTQVIAYAELRGWVVYHTHSSKYSEAGYPDLVMLRDTRQVVAELKRGPDQKPTEHQKKWIMAYLKLGVQVYLWRPQDWDTTEMVLF